MKLKPLPRPRNRSSARIFPLQLRSGPDSSNGRDLPAQGVDATGAKVEIEESTFACDRRQRPPRGNLSAQLTNPNFFSLPPFVNTRRRTPNSSSSSDSMDRNSGLSSPVYVWREKTRGEGRKRGMQRPVPAPLGKASEAALSVFSLSLSPDKGSTDPIPLTRFPSPLEKPTHANSCWTPRAARERAAG